MRAKLLAAATRLFAERGFDGTSLSAVAEAVGIRKPSLLYHFKSKHELRAAVLEDVLARWKDVVPQILGAATSGGRRFESAMAEVTAFFLDDPNRARLLLREMLDDPESLRALLSEHLVPWIPLITSFIQRGKDEGIIHPELDADAWVLLVVQMVVNTVALAGVTSPLFVGAESDAERRARVATEMQRIARASLFLKRPKPAPGAED